jgi:peptidoglycan lytic transglycosylase G
MSRTRRDDLGPGAERSAEQRQRDRLEREARRAHTARASGPPAPPREDQSPPSPDLRERRTPTPDERRARRAGRDGAGAGAGTGEPPVERAGRDRAPGRRAARAGASEPSAEPAGGDRAADRRAASRRLPFADRGGPQPVLRIQPEPPAPPAAPAGALDDENERPIGIRRVRRAVVQRTPRTIVTPPGDVPAGPARSRRSARGQVKALLALLILAALIGGALMLFQPFGSVQGARVRVDIPAGSSAREIGNKLSSDGVVGSGLLFSVRATLAGKRGDLRSGRHTMRRDMTYGAAIDELSKLPVSAPGATIRVTIPEGRSRRETARLIRTTKLRGDYLAASKRFSGRLDPYRYGAPRGTRSLEGFLFPSTYELKSGAPARDLVDRQIAAFRDAFAGVDLRRARRKQLTAYDVLIIASMVEREAQLADERPKIAAVIYNRLKDGIPLGIDATIRYALDNWSQPLKQSELQLDSAYNTRKRAGLPPTPIGNPGLASIRAAAAPADVAYRYYVVKPGTCGMHAFSSTFAQFQLDSRHYDQARNAAGGRSPTTC